MTTPSQAKTREEWEEKLSELERAFKSVGFDDASYSYIPNKQATEDDANQQKAALLDAIMSLQASVTKLQSEKQELYQSLCSTNTQYAQLEEQEKELRAEVQRLRAIKSEWESMIGPIFDFCHDSENGKSLGLRLGDQIHVHILKMLQEKARQPK